MQQTFDIDQWQIYLQLICAIPQVHGSSQWHALAICLQRQVRARNIWWKVKPVDDTEHSM